MVRQNPGESNDLERRCGGGDDQQFKMTQKGQRGAELALRLREVAGGPARASRSEARKRSEAEPGRGGRGDRQCHPLFREAWWGGDDKMEMAAAGQGGRQLN